MAFKNRIRVPLVFKKTQFPSEEELFTKSTGATEIVSISIRKTMIGETDQLPDFLHQRLVVALSHDEVNIESDKFVGQIVKEGAYNIEWQDWLNYPLGKAEFTARVTPFNASNYNCGTCTEYTQLSLENDEFYADLEEGETAQIYVFDNDSICCSPFTAEIIYYNNGYLTGVPTINQTTGEVELTVKTPVNNGVDILLAKYRVTCSNGQYHDANIYGNINGSIEACEPVSGLTAESDSETTADIAWDASPSAVNLYRWALYLSSDLETPVQTGTTTDEFVNLTGLSAGTAYVIKVIVDCLYNDNDSTGVTASFTTIATGGGVCGRFTIFNDGFPDPATVAYSYIDCNGILQHEFVETSEIICALMSSPGVPVYLVIHPGGHSAYGGLCEPAEEVAAVIGSTEFEACSGVAGTYYIAQADVLITTGTNVYMDDALSVPVGSGFIKDSASGEVFILNSGVVGASTGNIC